MQRRFAYASGNGRSDFMSVARPQPGRSRRVRRGVPFHGEPRTPREMMVARLREALEMAERIHTIVNTFLQRAPALEFLQHNESVPLDVRGQATDLADRCTVLEDAVVSAQRIPRSWVHRMRALLEPLELQNPQRRIGYAGEGLNRQDSASLAELNGCLEEIKALRVRLEAGHKELETFLAANERYLGFDPSDSCRPRGGAEAPPRGGTGAGGGAAGAGGGIGVQAAEEGMPEGITSHDAAFDMASWETHARFFDEGIPVNHNVHHRRYGFVDKSYLELHSGVPQLDTSAASDLAVVGSGLIGGSAGAWLGAKLGWLGALIGAVVGGATAMLIHGLRRPYDLVLQDYRVDYYCPPKAGQSGSRAKPQPCKVATLHGRKRSPDVTTPIEIDGIRDPARMPNLANRPKDCDWSGWRNNGSGVKLRPAQFDGCKGGASPTSAQASLSATLQQLLQGWDTFGQPGAAATPAVVAALPTRHRGISFGSPDF